MNSEERLQTRVEAFDKSKLPLSDHPVKVESKKSKIAWQTHMARISREKAEQRRHTRVACVYGLVDPRTKDLFYVGCTANLHRRVQQHKKTTPRAMEIAAANREVQVLILEFNPERRQSGDWPWIYFFTGKGILLEQTTIINKSPSKPRRPYRRKPAKEVAKRIW